MTPVLVSCDNTFWVILVVQMPSAIAVAEHAIGVIHEMLRRGEVNLGTVGAIVITNNRRTCRNINAAACS